MKMTSEQVFMDMVEEYAAIDTEGDTTELGFLAILSG
jgi:hypothetical protein